MLKTVPAFDRLGEENAFAVLARANALMAQGRDVINLGIGQPDFRTPEFIVEAAVKALRDGHHGYTPAVGITPLREAVAAELHKRFRVSGCLPRWEAPSTLLLPEQAASSAAKMNAATMRIMMRVPELDTRPMRTN